MLVLTRKRGQIVRIRGDITVTVLEVKGNQVRLGFVAPPGITIDREEIFEEKRHSAANAKDPAARK